MINEACFAEALGNLFGLFMLSLKLVDQIQANKVDHFHFDGHGAAIRSTGVAHAGLVAGPAVDAIDVDDANV